MKRKQFTFYESFFQAVEQVTSVRAKAQIYDALCRYALYEQAPEIKTMCREAAMIFVLIKPVLDTANKRANAGAAKKQNKNKIKSNQNEIETETENELETELERECERAGARERFEIFWEEFPKKVDKKSAWAVFQNVDAPLEVLLDGLRVQKMSSQWLEDGGRFIPRAAAWLRQRRWEDAVEVPAVPKGASGELGEAELAAIRKMMAQGE